MGTVTSVAIYVPPQLFSVSQRELGDDHFLDVGSAFNNLIGFGIRDQLIFKPDDGK
jgi:hypothetical protein